MRWLDLSRTTQLWPLCTRNHDFTLLDPEFPRELKATCKDEEECQGDKKRCHDGQMPAQAVEAGCDTMETLGTIKDHAITMHNWIS